jgi:hypothetical protein
MSVDPAAAISVTVSGTTYYFCSSHCKDKFIRESGAVDTTVCMPAKSLPWYRHKAFTISLGIALILAASFFLPVLVPFRHAFLAYAKTIWWAVALGLFLGGVIDYYVPGEYISKILAGGRATTIFNAVFLGFLMSACSHGILALSIQLHKKGASNPAVVSFLLASPWANLPVTLMLFGFFGMRALFIIGATLLVAITTGLVFMVLQDKGLIEKNTNTVVMDSGFSIIGDVRRRMRDYQLNRKTLCADIRGVIAGSVALADMVLWWILLGITIASAVGAYMPVHFFHRYMGPTILGLGVTLVLATVIEVCSEGSSPLAFEIYRQTHSLGNSFVFLAAGVVTDYTEIGLLWTNVGRRVALWLPLVTVPQVIVLGYVANRFIK